MKVPPLFFALLLSVALAPAAVAAIPQARDALLRQNSTPTYDERTEHPAAADRLIIRNPQGVELGYVINLLIDPELGKIAYVLVDTGSDLAEEDLRLVPVSALGAENDELILNMNKEQLANAPSPSPGQESIEFHRQLSDYYGVAPYWEE